MIATLMIFAAVVAAVLGLAALAAESLMRLYGRPTRWVWAAALATLVLLVALAPSRRSAAPESAPPPPSSVIPASLAALSFAVVPSTVSVPRGATNLLAIGWMAGSIALALVVVGVQLRYRRVRSRWPAVTVAGDTVRVSPTLGPAVMGFWRPEIVVPRWLLERGTAEQGIVVAHEREHLRARDPLLLDIALAIALVMPWNPAAWWILARLRLAVELDCDARVIRAGTAPRVYGNLLIDVAALHAGHRLPALALLNPPSNLQRRLMAMRPQSIRFARLRGTVATVIALGALVAACKATLPTDQDVEQLVAASAGSAALQAFAGDSVIYMVDGKVVDVLTAQSLQAGDIAFTEMRPGEGGRSRGSKPITVSIGTMDYAKDGSVPRGVETHRSISKTVTRIGDAGLEVQADTITYRKGDDTGTVVKHRKATFQGLIFIDGKPADLSQLEKIGDGHVKSLEILKGPYASKIYSDPAAAFGAIRVVTK